jgi:hypothetical protein
VNIKYLKLGFLALFFASQIYLPMSYYLRNYPWDERFSWRMFSSVRSLECKSQFFVESNTASMPCPDQSSAQCQSLRLSEKIHVVWINLIARGRLEVIDELSKKHCQNENENLFFVDLQCPDPYDNQNMIQVISPQQNLCKQPLDIESMTHDE